MKGKSTKTTHQDMWKDVKSIIKKSRARKAMHGGGGGGGINRQGEEDRLCYIGHLKSNHNCKACNSEHLALDRFRAVA